MVASRYMSSHTQHINEPTNAQHNRDGLYAVYTHAYTTHTNTRSHYYRIVCWMEWSVNNTHAHTRWDSKRRSEGECEWVRERARVHQQWHKKKHITRILMAVLLLLLLKYGWRCLYHSFWFGTISHVSPSSQQNHRWALCYFTIHREKTTFVYMFSFHNR